MESLRQEFRVATLLLGLVLIYAGIATATLHPFGREADVFMPSYGYLVLFTWGLAGVMIFLTYTLHLVLVRRPARPLMEMAADIRAHILPPDQLMMRLVPLVVLTLLLNSFTALKSAIPLIKPFAYDTLFADIDRMIFGTDPWRLTHAVFGGPIATWLLQWAYTCWFFLMWISVIYAALRTDCRTLRARYLLAFCLTWMLLGSAAAMALSSAGPCFYGLLLPGVPDPFAPLMERLHALDAIVREQIVPTGLMTLEVQKELWSDYQAASTTIGSGISAMPSLHVASSILMACAGFSLGRKLGLALSLFAFTIWIGSVHLGWHYAIDGMVSLVLVLPIWWLSGRVVSALGVSDHPFPRARALAGLTAASPAARPAA